jgi:class 3 adenylate cyclase
MAAVLDEKLLDEKLASLETARSWSPRVISKLETHIRSADEEALFRINPFSFAAEKNISENEALDLFLHAAALGLFEMDWLLVCPACSCVVDNFRNLKGVNQNYHCHMCQMDYESRLDEFIAVYFTVSPVVREISLHHPEELSARDYVFKYFACREGRLPDGTPMLHAQQAITRTVEYLPPGDTVRLTIEAEEGAIVGVSPEGRIAFAYAVEGAPTSGTPQVNVVYGEKARTHALGKTTRGATEFLVENPTDRRGCLHVAVVPPWFKMGEPLDFAPFLTGKRLLTTQTFRDLFRSEVIRSSEGLGVRRITLLFTDLKGSTALYDRIGDLNAFALVQRHFEHLQDAVVRHRGAIIKTIGDAVMAAFLEPADAVKAALAMRHEIAAFNRAQPNRSLVLKIGVHNGSAIAVTQNDRLDYFGQTVNVAARVQGLAEADEICVTEDIFEADDVQGELANFVVEREVAKLRGIDQDYPVFRIRAAAAGRGAT